MRTYHLTRSWSDQRQQKLAEWTAAMMGASEATAAKIGCSPAAIVAQAALESGWGAAAIGNNVFGIKADSSWTGKRQLVWTREVIDRQSVMIQAWFRDYDSLADCIADHFEFLVRNTRYAAAGVFDYDDSKSDEEYFAALKRGGYATDPDYVASLVAMLKSVHLFTTYMRVSEGPEPPPPPPRLLRLGLAGPDVLALQTALQALGFYSFKLDGDYGPKTRDAVWAFQLARKLRVDGIAGDETRGALNLA